MTRNVMLIAVTVLTASSVVMAMQRRGGPGGPGGPGGALPSYYTNTSTPLGAVDTGAADRACNTAQGHARLVCLANALKTGMAPGLLARLQLAYSVADAERWSNFPPMGYRNRVGPTLAELTPDERGVVKALLKTAAGITGGEGYDEIEQILNADDFLKDNTGETGFASGNYHIAFLGTPAASGTWELYFGGHHLAVSSTFKDGVMVGATPSFRGVEPFTTFRENGRENAPLAQERDAFAAMLQALGRDEQSKAHLNQTYTDIIVGPQRDNNFPATRAGIRVGDLPARTQDLVLAAVATYVRDVDPPDADAILAKYRRELPETFVAFSGTPSMNSENDYVRVDGPSVWIECSIQPGRSVPGVHPHSVWRDRKTDYGGNK